MRICSSGGKMRVRSERCEVSSYEECRARRLAFWVVIRIVSEEGRKEVSIFWIFRLVFVED